MNNRVSLTIDGNPAEAPIGTSILDAAHELGIDIPTICFHDACTANGICRLCVVEVSEARLLAPACVTPVQENMQVFTASERVNRARRTILEMLASAVDLSDAPEILEYIEKYQADPARFPEAERRRMPVIDDNPMFVRDYEKCVLCWRCVQVCAEDAQYTYAIHFTGRGFHSGIGTFFDRPLPATTCVFCGQCIGVCPSGALKPKAEWLLERGLPPEDIFQVTRIDKKKGSKKRSQRAIVDGGGDD